MLIFRFLINVCSYLREKEVWVPEAYACADPRFRLNLRIANETPWANLFCHNLFLCLTEKEVQEFSPDG